MQSSKEGFSLTVTPNLLGILSQSAGATFSAEQLTAIADGTYISAGYGVNGCISSLSYSSDEETLCSVTILLPPLPPGTGTRIHGSVLLSPDTRLRSDSIRVLNLNAFRHRFQDAANFGYGVTVNLDGNGNIEELTLVPCSCLCAGDRAKSHLPATMDPLP